ncbi:MAG: zinc ribbon domain-containing protein [Thermoplasmata archaeon]
MVDPKPSEGKQVVDEKKKELVLTDEDKKKIVQTFEQYPIPKEDMTLEAKYKLESPKNMMESKFIISSVEDYFAAHKEAMSRDVDYKNFLDELNLAKKYYTEKNYTEAFRHGIKAKRYVKDSGELSFISSDSKPEEEEPEHAQPTNIASNAVVCKHCGAKLKENAKFCSNCGTPVSRDLKCPSCGQPYETGEKFCSSCGAKLV